MKWGTVHNRQQNFGYHLILATNMCTIDLTTYKLTANETWHSPNPSTSAQIFER